MKCHPQTTFAKNSFLTYVIYPKFSFCLEAFIGMKLMEKERTISVLFNGYLPLTYICQIKWIESDEIGGSHHFDSWIIIPPTKILDQHRLYYLLRSWLYGSTVYLISTFLFFSPFFFFPGKKEKEKESVWLRVTFHNRMEKIVMSCKGKWVQICGESDLLEENTLFPFQTPTPQKEFNFDMFKFYIPQLN